MFCMLVKILTILKTPYIKTCESEAGFAYVIGVMKMGPIVPKVGLEPTSLAFLASVLPLHHVGSLMYHAYLSMQLLASKVSAD